MCPVSSRGSENRSPSTPQVEGLPSFALPACAHHAPGPFLREQIVTPTSVRWFNARTYIVRHADDRQEYRALRITDGGGHFLGYWAIEILPPALDLGDRFEGDRLDAIEDYTKAQTQTARDRARKRYGRHHD